MAAKVKIKMVVHAPTRDEAFRVIREMVDGASPIVRVSWFDMYAPDTKGGS